MPYRDCRTPIHLHDNRQSQRDHRSDALVHTVSQGCRQKSDLFPKHWDSCFVNWEELLDNMFQTRSSAIDADPHDTMYQFKCCTTAVQVMHTPPISAWGAVSATATFYSATCVVCRSRLNYRTASMRCRACHQQTFIQPTLLMSTGP